MKYKIDERNYDEDFVPLKYKFGWNDNRCRRYRSINEKIKTRAEGFLLLSSFLIALIPASIATMLTTTEQEWLGRSFMFFAYWALSVAIWLPFLYWDRTRTMLQTIFENFVLMNTENAECIKTLRTIEQFADFYKAIFCTYGTNKKAIQIEDNGIVSVVNDSDIVYDEKISLSDATKYNFLKIEDDAILINTETVNKIAKTCIKAISDDSRSNRGQGPSTERYWTCKSLVQLRSHDQEQPRDTSGMA